MSTIHMKHTNTEIAQSFSSWLARFHSIVLLLIAFHFSFLIINCGLDVEDPNSPLAPVWVQKSLPEEWPERGIDAHESDGIYLEWESGPEEDIKWYNIYRATWYGINDSLGEYALLTRLETGSTPEMEYIDRSADIRTKYFYKAKAEDASGNLSQFSDSLVYSLLPQLNSEWMHPNGSTVWLNDNRALSWLYSNAIEMEDYYLTILGSTNEFVFRVAILPENYIDISESWQIPLDVPLDSGKIYKWRIDTGANYLNGRETSGSESIWATFLFAGD